MGEMHVVYMFVVRWTLILFHTTFITDFANLPTYSCLIHVYIHTLYWLKVHVLFSFFLPPPPFFLTTSVPAKT